MKILEVGLKLDADIQNVVERRINRREHTNLAYDFRLKENPHRAIFCDEFSIYSDEHKGKLLEKLLEDFFDEKNKCHIEGEQRIIVVLPWYNPGHCRRVRDYFDSFQNGNKGKEELLEGDKVDLRNWRHTGKISVNGEPKYKVDVQEGAYIHHCASEISLIK